MMKISRYVKVTGEYDGCFEVGEFYRIYREYRTGMALLDKNGNIWEIPKDCLEGEDD